MDELLDSPLLPPVGSPDLDSESQKNVKNVKVKKEELSNHRGVGVYVSNWPADVEEKTIRDLFQNLAGFSSFYRFPHHAFVNFDTLSNALSAIEVMNKHKIGDKKLKVKLQTEKNDKNPKQNLEKNKPPFKQSGTDQNPKKRNEKKKEVKNDPKFKSVKKNKEKALGKVYSDLTKNQILVSNLSDETTKSGLKKKFAEFGDFKIKMMENAAVISFDLRKDAKIAEKTLNGEKIDGKLIKIQRGLMEKEIDEEELLELLVQIEIMKRKKEKKEKKRIKEEKMMEKELKEEKRMKKELKTIQEEKEAYELELQLKEQRRIAKRFELKEREISKLEEEIADVEVQTEEVLIEKELKRQQRIEKKDQELSAARNAALEDLDTCPPNWSSNDGWGSLETCDKISFSLSDAIVPPELIQGSSETIQVRMKSKPFGCGTFRSAYFMKMEGNSKKFVAKKFITGGEPKELLEKCKVDVRTHLIASDIATKFNKVSSQKKMKYVEVFVLHFKLRSRPEYWIVEELLGSGWQKFNNNNGFVEEGTEGNAAQAFSHFSFETTSKKMMVVDIQGVKEGNNFLLTDPAIHSIGHDLCDGDCGEDGMKVFFKSHQCNEICSELSLPKTK